MAANEFHSAIEELNREINRLSNSKRRGDYSLAMTLVYVRDVMLKHHPERIAAAPEMLKELKRLAANCECQAEGGCRWCAPTLAVIAKAEGK